MARTKRKVIKDFTTVQNDFLRDRNLGWTERGVLMTMLSLPDGWDFSSAGLTNIVPDGLTKTKASLKKLEEAGYLQRNRIFENGKVVDWEYEFCELPLFKNQSINTETEEDNAKFELQMEKPIVEKLQTENLLVENLLVENPPDNKILNKSNTNKSISTINLSINHTLSDYKTNVAPEEKDRLIDGNLIDEIKEQIGYSSLALQIRPEDLNAAVNAIAMLKTVTGIQTFGDSKYAADYVRSRADKINSLHVQYVFECFYKSQIKVNNIIAYLKTAFFNAPDSMGVYYANAVESDKWSV